MNDNASPTATARFAVTRPPGRNREDMIRRPARGPAIVDTARVAFLERLMTASDGIIGSTPSRPHRAVRSNGRSVFGYETGLVTPDGGA